MTKFVAIAALLALTTPVLADGGPDFFNVAHVKKGDELKLRDGPTPEGLWVGGLDAGTKKVRNLGCISGREIWVHLKNETLKPSAFDKQTWCKVTASGAGEGWANARFLVEAQ